MKIKKTFLSILSLALCLTASAQITASDAPTAPPAPSLPAPQPATLPSTLPIKSLKALKAYAFTLVDDIEGFLTTGIGSADPGNHFSVPYRFADADPEHMASVTRAQSLLIRMSPDEKFSSWLAYNGSIITSDPQTGLATSSQYQLFYGGGQYSLVTVKAGYAIPNGVFNPELDMSDWIPVSVPGVTNAVMSIKDNSGNVIQYYDFANQGRISPSQGLLFFGKDQVAQSGTLYLDVTGIGRVEYDAGTGTKKVLENISITGISPTIKGVRSVPDGTKTVVYQPGDEIVRVMATNDMVITVTFPDGLSSYPSGMSTIDTVTLKLGGMTAKWLDFPPFKNVSFGVQKGQVILIRFDEATEGRVINQPYYYDGKG